MHVQDVSGGAEGGVSDQEVSSSDETGAGGTVPETIVGGEAPSGGGLDRVNVVAAEGSTASSVMSQVSAISGESAGVADLRRMVDEVICSRMESLEGRLAVWKDEILEQIKNELVEQGGGSGTRKRRPPSASEDVPVPASAKSKKDSNEFTEEDLRKALPEGQKQDLVTFIVETCVWLGIGKWAFDHSDTSGCLDTLALVAWMWMVRMRYAELTLRTASYRNEWRSWSTAIANVKEEQIKLVVALKKGRSDKVGCMCTRTALDACCCVSVSEVHALWESGTYISNHGCE